MEGRAGGFRPVWAEIDLAAIRSNVAALRACAAPAALLAVVKADGYGHGARPVAEAALDAGARGLGVALVEEGVALREAGITAPILVLAEPPPVAAGAVVEHGLTPVVYTRAGVESLARAAAAAGRRVPVHLKVDTGMHRVGCRPDEALDLAATVAAHPELDLEGLCTHLAVADEPGNPATDAQLDAFDAVRRALDAAGHRARQVHAANSAAALAVARARYDVVRPGIALYGLDPGAGLAAAAGVTLRPALRLVAQVTYVRDLPAGERISYGLRYSLPRAGRVATIPMGYADGVPRGLGAMHVLIHGRRYPVAGTITMDQLMIDVGGDLVEIGDEVVLIGRQGDAEITADDWATQLRTINYEIVSRIGPRVPRRYAP